MYAHFTYSTHIAHTCNLHPKNNVHTTHIHNTHTRTPYLLFSLEFSEAILCKSFKSGIALDNFKSATFYVKSPARSSDRNHWSCCTSSSLFLTCSYALNTTQFSALMSHWQVVWKLFIRGITQALFSLGIVSLKVKNPPGLFHFFERLKLQLIQLKVHHYNQYQTRGKYFCGSFSPNCRQKYVPNLAGTCLLILNTESSFTKSHFLQTEFFICTYVTLYNFKQVSYMKLEFSLL